MQKFSAKRSQPNTSTRSLAARSEPIGSWLTVAARSRHSTWPAMCSVSSLGKNTRYRRIAIVDSRILVIKRTAVEALAARDNQVARGLLALMARELQRVQRHVTLLVMTAQERVIDFLLEMTACDPEKALTLPMSRQDIADYLGLTIETVSRTFSSLETAAAIELPNSRRVVLRDREALSRLAN